jgi:hypothetical protein
VLVLHSSLLSIQYPQGPAKLQNSSSVPRSERVNEFETGVLRV